MMFFGARHLGCLLFVSIIPWGGLSSQTPVTSTPSVCERLVSVFLALPNKNSFDELAQPDQKTCWAAFESSNANFNKLEHWVEHGNRWAAEYISQHLKHLDGGNLEDALRALGEFSNHDMERLLWFTKTGLLTKVQLSDALTMLPLPLTDDPKAQLAALSRRRINAVQVTAKELSEQRAEALSAIDGFAAEIRSKNLGTSD